MISMIAQKAPMGWNSWNTFGEKINDQLIRETADAMVEQGYLAAGYEYLVIDDCWSLRDRDAEGRLVADPAKFPNGMKAVADYVHSKGLKFGMYSCAGIMTCAGYPSSYDHEFVDAQTFADWGVDFLKYDFCNFPEHADCKTRYATMSMALKATGREILFSACNWGKEDPWNWMRSIGVHMYRSTGDIQDNFISFTNILRSQIPNFAMSGNFCFNDIDMLTVGMYGKGNVALGKACTDSDYKTQFALWAMFSAPLMLGGDIRSMSDYCKQLVLNRNLIRINQDIESRAPYQVFDGKAQYGSADWWNNPDHTALTFIKHMSDGEFAIGYFNLGEKGGEVSFTFANAGLPYQSGYGFELTDAFTGENIGVKRDYFNPYVDAHDCAVYIARIIKA